jgi:alanine dehydrogenase
VRIGIPREIKTLEGRVGLVPAAVAELVGQGHQVLLEKGAGLLSGYTDIDYEAAGAHLLADAAAVYGAAELIVKVKEPQHEELSLLRADHRLFCYLHLAAEPALQQALLEIGLTAVGFETVAEGGTLPLLAPMSDIAGRVAVQSGAQLLHHSMGGRGVLLGGLPAAERGHVVVIGAGVAGGNAARLAASLGARVTVFDRNRDKLAAMHGVGANVTALHPFARDLHEAVLSADLLIGAVLIPGARTPHLVSADQVRLMQPGSVIIDISVDQGGCIETIHPTNHADPTYVWEGVIHYGVTNMPGAVPRSASQSLSAALIPYVSRLARDDWQEHPALASGINVMGGKVIHPALQQLAG